MNLQHVLAFVWLRFRLRANQLKRGGIVNSIILAMIGGLVLLGAVGLFLMGFVIGLFALRDAPPVAKLLTWDGIVIGVIFVWMIGLLTDLQRTDGLSLDKFLHLPVSPLGAFAVNYVSSLAGVTLILFVSGTVGLIVGQLFSAGPQMLLAFPLLAAFVLALTAVTYQFQGWLASLMTNPRRRRTVIVVVTLSFILVFQLPNLIHLIRPWESKSTDSGPQYVEQLQQLNQALNERKITLEEHQRQSDEAHQKYRTNIEESSQRTWQTVEQTAQLMSTLLPPGWLAVGMAGLAEGAVLPMLLGTVGFTLIGSFCLWRAYRTTLRMYTGYGEGGRGGHAATPNVIHLTPIAGAEAKVKGPETLRLVEWKLPWLNEHATTIALSGFRSFIRRPEAKMALLAPIILVVVFGSMLVAQQGKVPLAVRPLIAVGAIGFVLMTSLQLIGNQFAYDRAGFRVYVLSPASRRDILLGKNLALAPFVLALIAVALVALECLCPLRIDHFLAAFAQAVAMFLLFCLPANLVSILSPLPIKAGAMQPSQVKFTQVLGHMMLMFVFPLASLPLLLPLGIELLFSELTGISPLPIALPLTILLLIGVVFLYGRGLVVLGRLLTAREQKVLEIVTSQLE